MSGASRSAYTCGSPATQCCIICEFSSKNGLLQTKKLARYPFLSTPMVDDAPMNSAGFVVSAANATFSGRPYWTAFRRLRWKACDSFNPEAVNANEIPALVNAAGLVGASSQC